MPVEVHLAEDEVDAVLAFRAYKLMHAEGGIPGSVLDIKLLTNVIRLVKGPDSVVLLAMDGDNLAGVLSLYKETTWFNDEPILSDKGMFVAPAYRNGEAGKLLLDAAIKVSDDTGIPVYITINNGRRKRGGRSEWERLGATLGYVNRGATIAHFPEN